ncbi:hypothetical protein BH11PSE8_BH11PSE8_37730 [soil metagenome]
MFAKGSSNHRALTIVAVLAFHLALLWLLRDASMNNAARSAAISPASRITLRLIAAPPREASPAVPTSSPVTVPVPEANRARPTVALDRARTPPRAATASIGASSSNEITPPQVETAMRAEPPASAPDAAHPLLDTEATRRAIRASARAPSLHDQLAIAREEPAPVNAQQRLANGVKSAGKGDCMKGEFAGGGMGLLSIPFLAAAVATGACAK